MTVIMERNMDLIREILLRIEQYNPRQQGSAFLKIQPSGLPQRFQSLDKGVIADHIALLLQDGLIDDANPLTGAVGALTWRGHDYLDEIRDPVWFEKLKKHINP
jgi:hypothetical protein